MNINHLKCFESVYENRSINKAARQLFMTPQGVGKSIQCLENELETELFSRSKNGVLPTASGHLLHKKAEGIIAQLEELKAAIEQLNAEKVRLRIGYVSGAFNVLPFDAILKFIHENPEIEVTWNEYPITEVHELLRNSEIEYGLGVGINRKAANDGVFYRKVEIKNAVALVYEGHPLYNAESIDVGMLEGEQILLPNEDHYIHHKFLDLCAEHCFSPRIATTASDSNALLAMCSQKIGIAVLPEYTFQNIKLEGIRAIPFRDEFNMVVHGAYKKENEHIETVRRFDRFLAANIKK